MGSPYVYERQSEYQISRQIEEFMLDACFEIITFPLTQFNERIVPADFIFFDKNHSKLFGFQYKVLYRNGRDYWPISERQYKTLKQFTWIYYCLSEVKNLRELRTSLHFCRIMGDFKYRDKLYPDENSKFPYYSRWGAFYQGLEQCRKGVVVQSRDHLVRLLNPSDKPKLPRELGELLIDVFLIDFKSHHAIHYSPFLLEHRSSQAE